MTNAEARFNKSLRPRKPEGSLGRTAQDVHLDSHTAPELCRANRAPVLNYVVDGLFTWPSSPLCFILKFYNNKWPEDKASTFLVKTCPEGSGFLDCSETEKNELPL